VIWLAKFAFAMLIVLAFVGAFAVGLGWWHDQLGRVDGSMPFCV
jgi:hypothetical protein